MTPNDQIDSAKPRSSRRPQRWTVIIVLVVIGTLTSIFAWRAYVAPRGEAITDIVNGVTQTNVKQLAIVVKTNYEEYRLYSTRWSAIFFSCTLGSAVFSAFAGFVLKLKAFSNAGVAKEDLAALLAMLAALLITMSTAGDFQRKWQANRIAAADTEALAYDLLKNPFTDADKENLIKKLKEISLTRNREIVGDKPTVVPEGSPTATPKPPANSNASP